MTYFREHRILGARKKRRDPADGRPDPSSRSSTRPTPPDTLRVVARASTRCAGRTRDTVVTHYQRLNYIIPDYVRTGGRTEVGRQELAPELEARGTRIGNRNRE
jgi:hypothetical protein